MVANVHRASNNTILSGAGSFNNAVDFTLRGDLNDEEELRVYAEAESGFQVVNAQVAIEGARASKWQLALDSGGSPGSYEDPGQPLSLGTVGPGSSRVFCWIKGLATDDEAVGIDDSVTLRLTGLGEPI